MLLQRELESLYQIGRANIWNGLNNRVMRNDQCDKDFLKPSKKDVRNCRLGNLMFILGKLAEASNKNIPSSINKWQTFYNREKQTLLFHKETMPHKFIRVFERWSRGGRCGKYRLCSERTFSNNFTAFISEKLNWHHSMEDPLKTSGLIKVQAQRVEITSWFYRKRRSPGSVLRLAFFNIIINDIEKGEDCKAMTFAGNSRF